MGLPFAICISLVFFITTVLLAWTLKETCDELTELKRWLIKNGHARYDVDLDGCTEFNLVEEEANEPEKKRASETMSELDRPGPRECGHI